MNINSAPSPAKTMGNPILHVLLHVLALLYTQAGYAQISFPEEPVNTTVLQEGRMSLRCVAMDASKRRANVSWRVGADEPLSNRFRFDPASGALSLPLVQCDDAGWYTCVASDGSETAEKRVYLTVLCGTAPSFARALPPKHSFTNVQSLGKSAVVQCYAKGSPPPDMKWEKEGEMLPSSPTTDGPYAIGGTLHLVSSRPGDSGEYCCVAENELGTAVKCTTVNIVEETPPLWLSWWMLALYCVVAVVVLLSVPLCCRLAVERCRRKKSKLSEVQSYASEGVLGRRSAPAWLCDPASEASPEGVRESAFQNRTETGSINDETVEGEEGGGSSDESLTNTDKGNTAAPPFGIEVVKATAFSRPMMWYECWNKQGSAQQEDSPLGKKGGGQKHSHSPCRHAFHSKQKSTTAKGLPDNHASPQRKVPSRASKADKIRKSEGKDLIRQWGSPHLDQMADSTPVDMKLQLVEVGDDEDENVVPNLLFSAPNGAHNASLTSNAQTEDTLLSYASRNVAVDNTSSPEPLQVSQLREKVVRDSTLHTEPTRTSLSPSPSRVASLGSMSPTESQIDLHTDEAFSFLDAYDLTSDLAEEDGWGREQGRSYVA